MAGTGLAPNELRNLKASLKNRESGGNYSAENRLGYIGAYQFGAAALIDRGYVNAGTTNAGLNNPNNWTSKCPGGKQQFLNTPAMQEEAMDGYLAQNAVTLKNIGVITSGSTPQQISGYLATAHLLGTGGARDLKNGTSGSDANGATAASYFGIGVASANGIIYEKGTKIPATTPATTGDGTSVASQTGSTSSTSTSSVYRGTGGFTSTLGNTQTISVTAGPEPKIIKGPIDNPLNGYVTFNNIFTFNVLTSEELNNPDETYRKGILNNIIFRSGGGLPNERIQIETGKYEYYIDDVEIDSIICFNKRTQNTNATTIKFSVVEPYSMGLFLQSLQVGALETGNKNYIDAPFLLTCEFIGYNNDGVPTQIPNTYRQIPMKLTKVEMEVTAGGCKYAVEGLPYNEIALNDVNNLFKTDIAIKGSSVQEMLQSGPQSLQYVLNARLQEMNKLAAKTNAANNKPPVSPVADEIIIIFPNFVNSNQKKDDQGTGTDSVSSSATISPTESTNSTMTVRMGLSRGQNTTLVQEKLDMNDIGKAEMNFTAMTGGNQGSIADDKAWVDGIVQQNKVEIKQNEREYQFKQGTSITNAITQVLLMSSYCKNPLINKDNQTMKWFRIETQVFQLDSNDANVARGRKARLLVYKVIPYEINPTWFKPRSETTKYDLIKKNAIKSYQYLYTGKNIDILKFDIKLNTAFYQGIQADAGQLNQYAYRTSQNAAGVEKESKQPVSLGVATESPVTGTPPQEYVVENKYYKQAGGIIGDYKSVVARNIQIALLESSTDLVSADMTVLGDPYYIADSGMGNFSNTNGGLSNITDTGAMDYQSSEVFVLIEFRNPIDLGNDGIMSFGPESINHGFSGVYRVNEVSNKWNLNKFTQELKMIRMPGQPEQAPVISNTTSGVNTTTTLPMINGSMPVAPVGIVNGGPLDSATSGYESTNNSATANPNQTDASTVVDSGDTGLFDWLFGGDSVDEFLEDIWQ